MASTDEANARIAERPGWGPDCSNAFNGLHALSSLSTVILAVSDEPPNDDSGGGTSSNRPAQ